MSPAVERLWRQLTAHGSRIALSDGERQWRYAELLHEVEVILDASASLLSHAVLDDTLDTDIALHVITQLEKAGRYMAAAR